MARNSLKNVIRLIDEAKQELPVEQNFLADLRRSIELSDEKNFRKGSQAYKPSSMNCIRQMYYIVTGAEPQSDSDCSGVCICNAGTDIHQRIQQAVLDMRNNGINCEYINVADYVRSRELSYLDVVKEPDFENGDYETKLYHKTLNMSFLCDGIIRYQNKHYILELKSESSKKFAGHTSVHEEHFNQATAYSLSLQIDDVLFVYINRDSFAMKSCMLTPTDQMKQELVGKIQTCDEHIQKHKVPKRPNDVSCVYCKYHAQCRKDG